MTPSHKRAVHDNGTDRVKKVLYAGLGAASAAGEQAANLAKRVRARGTEAKDLVEGGVAVLAMSIPEPVTEQVAKVSDELTRRIKVTRERAAKALAPLAKDLEKRGRGAAETLGKRAAKAGAWLETRIEAILRRVGFATRRELSALDSRLDSLEKRLAKLEKAR